MNFFEAINVSKSFTGHQALENVTISVPEQSVFGLLGPNGAGKTTLIRIINQITAPDTGKILIGGKPLKKEHTNIIGYLPEERGLYKKMTTGEQAMYLARLKGLSNKEAEKKLKKWFEKFDLLRWWNKKVEELSKGMQQKVQFIVTILHEPKLLIFDEPFSGFDPINTQLLKEEILKIRENGATIIFSTHNMGSVEEICDDIALINRAKKILEGRVDEIRQRFSENIFDVEITPTTTIELIKHEDIKIISSKNINGKINLKVKFENGDHTNELISELMKYGKISKFNEIMPSMNDIFIKLVNESNPSKLL